MCPALLAVCAVPAHAASGLLRQEAHRTGAPAERRPARWRRRRLPRLRPGGVPSSRVRVSSSRRTRASLPRLAGPPDHFTELPATAQAVPLSVYEVGEAVSPVWEAWKPMSTDAPGAMVALWETFLAVTRPDAGE